MKLSGVSIAAISCGALILVWAAAAALLAAPFILPGPAAVFQDVLRLITRVEFQKEIIATFYRGFLAFTISLGLSLILGTASGVSGRAEAALKPWLSVIKSTPVVSIILIALLWFGSSIVPIFVSILMTLPVMTEALAKGIRETDPKLLEMARIYRFKRRSILVHVQLGTAVPFLLAGAGSALGLTWKVVVAGEILGLPRHGLGTAIQTARVQLESVRVFSLTVTAIALSVISEFVFSRLASRFSRTRKGTMERNGGMR